MPKNVLIDSGYWIALYQDGDTHHDDAILINEYLLAHRLIIPWPSLYEFLNTKFFKRPISLTLFRKTILLPNVIRIPDSDYRESAFTNFLNPRNLGRRLSLVDLVIREILADESVKIDSMVTFNEKDFADACARRKINLFYG